MNTKILLKKLAKRFPKRLAKIYHDHVGLMCGCLPNEVNKILLCLDFDEIVLPYVKEYKPDIIITHHPFIYGSKAKILKNDPIKKKLVDELEVLNIPVYSFHTNFDAGSGGMNDALAAALKLENIYAPQKEIMMRIGTLANVMEIHEFAKYAKNCLDIEYGQLVNAGSKTIKKIGIIGGGGSRDFPTAILENCDIYISGDAPHYVRRDIIARHFNYLDFPHEIEKIFMPTMKELLLSYDQSLDIKIIDHENRPEII